MHNFLICSVTSHLCFFLFNVQVAHTVVKVLHFLSLSVFPFACLFLKTNLQMKIPYNFT